MTEQTEPQTTPETPAEDRKEPGIKRRLDKAKFVSMVKAHTRPGRPAYAALARALGDMLGIALTLAEPVKCPTCGKTFVPWAKSQTHCSTKCSNVDRQRRYRVNQAAKSKAPETPEGVQ